jgi:hypothetical protein
MKIESEIACGESLSVNVNDSSDPVSFACSMASNLHDSSGRHQKEEDDQYVIKAETTVIPTRGIFMPVHTTMIMSEDSKIYNDEELK